MVGASRGNSNLEKDLATYEAKAEEHFSRLLSEALAEAGADGTAEIKETDPLKFWFTQVCWDLS